MFCWFIHKHQHQLVVAGSEPRCKRQLHGERMTLPTHVIRYTFQERPQLRYVTARVSPGNQNTNFQTELTNLSRSSHAQHFAVAIFTVYHNRHNIMTLLSVFIKTPLKN